MRTVHTLSASNFYNLATLNEQGVGSVNMKQALRGYREAASEGFCRGALSYVTALCGGCLKQDAKRSKQHRDKACEAGLVEACH